jgi:hypothetical protein
MNIKENFAVKIILLLVSLFLPHVVSADRFTPPNINGAHDQMQARVQDSNNLVNSDYIKSHVVNRVKKKIREFTNNDNDVVIFDEGIQQQDDGDNLIGSVQIEPGATVEGDIYIVDLGEGDNTIIDN